MQRSSIIFRGRVQGVGFRQTAAELAEVFKVTGTVRNLSDGDVELVVEGSPEVIAEFVQAIDRRLGRYVESHKERVEPAGGEFSDFNVIR